MIKQLSKLKELELPSQETIEEVHALLKDEGVLYIIGLCYKWDPRMTTNFILTMDKSDIVEALMDLNKGKDFLKMHQNLLKDPKGVSIIDRNVFADVISKWNCSKKSFALGSIGSGRDVDSYEGEQKEANSDDTDLLNKLSKKLKEDKVFYIVDLYKVIEPDFDLLEVLEYEKRDIFELVNTINDRPIDKKVSFPDKKKICKNYLFVFKQRKQLIPLWIMHLDILALNCTYLYLWIKYICSRHW